MPATLVSNLDQIATAGIAPTPSNSNISFADFNATNTILTSLDVTPPHSGRTVLRFSTTQGDYTTLRWGLDKWTGTPTGNTYYHRFYFRMAFAPSAVMAIAGHQRDDTYGTVMLEMTTARKLRILDGSGVSRGTLATVVPVGQWVRIETQAVLAASGGYMRVRLYLSPESTTPTEDYTSSTADTLYGAFGLTWVGIGDAWGGGTSTNYYADSAWSDTTWVGPISQQSATVSMSASHTLSGTTTGFQVRQGAVSMTASHSMLASGTVTVASGLNYIATGGTLVSIDDAVNLAELLKEDSNNGRIDDEVIAAILSGVTQVTRRAEIYEADGETLWLPTQNTPHLIDGEISVDYTRDERRSLDCTFDNSDRVLDHNPNGFWYDKVIKCFRGIRYQNKKIQPSILVIQDDSVTSQRIFLMLRALKYTDITVQAATTLEDLYGFDVVVAASGNSTISSGNSTLLQAAFDAGYNVLTAGNQNTEAQLPDLISTTIAKTNTQPWEINQAVNDNPVRPGWGSSILAGNTSTGRHITALAATGSPVAAYTWAGVGGYTGAYSINATGGRWLHLQLVISPQTNANLTRLVKNSVSWLYSYAQEREWEIQVGEFMIDKISHDVFPHTIKITGRDYTKKVMLTKFKDSLTFSAGTLVDTLVRALGANAGIRKFMLNAGSVSLTTDMTFARGDDRWKAIKDCCTASGVEVFFNSAGYLVTRPFKDPVTAPTTFALSLRPEDANLTELGIESSDTSIFNTVVVTAENADSLSDGVFYQGTAVNNASDSATAVSRIGERTYMYNTAAATSDSQCLTIATNLLRVMALEEYSLNFSALVFPWADAGDIILFKNKSEGDSVAQDPLSIANLTPYQTAVDNDNPVVWFHMDDSSGLLVDSVGGMTAAVTGTVTYGVSGLSFESGSLGIGFTNTALNYVEAPANDILAPTNITVEALFKSNGLTSGNHIVQYGNGTSWRLVYETGQLVWEVNGHSKSAYTWAGDTNPHYVAGTYDAASGYSYLYLDGTLVASQTSTVTPGAPGSPTTDTFRIGQRPGGSTNSEGWNGTLDEIAVYDRMLSSAAVSAHATARTQTTTTTVQTVDPVPATPEVLPDRFLLTSVNIPLGLAPMSGVAKRVTIVAPLEDADV